MSRDSSKLEVQSSKTPLSLNTTCARIYRRTQKSCWNVEVRRGGIDELPETLTYVTLPNLVVLAFRSNGTSVDTEIRWKKNWPLAFCLPRSLRASEQTRIDRLSVTSYWRFGVAVTRWSRSTQLLYIEPG